MGGARDCWAPLRMSCHFAALRVLFAAGPGGKWSSNVVEKCFGVDDIGLEEERRKLFEAVLASPDDPCPPLLQMTRDSQVRTICGAAHPRAQRGGAPRSDTEADRQGGGLGVLQLIRHTVVVWTAEICRKIQNIRADHHARNSSQIDSWKINSTVQQATKRKK